jgi:oxygen-dependent protoporphyrinogen oxidase
MTAVRQDLEAMVGITSQPHYGEVHRWHKGMPQYLVGHLQRVSHIRQEVEKYRGFEVTGAAFEGIGIPDCIREGSRTASQLAKDLWPKSHG